MKPENVMEFINQSDREFKNITSEEYREYRFTNGIVRIDQPICICVGDNGHRVFDGKGISHYIPMGWIHLSWKAKTGSPNFVF